MEQEREDYAQPNVQRYTAFSYLDLIKITNLVGNLLVLV